MLFTTANFILLFPPITLIGLLVLCRLAHLSQLPADTTANQSFSSIF
jgi:hypothetical protein